MQRDIVVDGGCSDHGCNSRLLGWTSVLKLDSVAWSRQVQRLFRRVQQRALLRGATAASRTDSKFCRGESQTTSECAASVVEGGEQRAERSICCKTLQQFEAVNSLCRTATSQRIRTFCWHVLSAIRTAKVVSCRNAARLKFCGCTVARGRSAGLFNPSELSSLAGCCALWRRAVQELVGDCTILSLHR